MKLISNLRISSRLIAGFSIVLALAIMAIAISLFSAKRNNDETRAMMELPLAKERLVADWYVMTYSAIARTSMIARSTDANLSENFKEVIANSVTTSTAIIKKIEPLLASDEEKALFNDIVGIRKTYQSAKELVMNARKNGDGAAAEKAYVEVFDPAAKKYSEKVQSLLAMQRKSIDQMAAEIDRNNVSSMQLISVLGALLIIISAVAALYIASSITGPLKRALQIAKLVAAGDLTARIDAQGKDEIAELMLALNEMNSGLRKIVTEVQEGTAAIAHAANEISSGNADLSSRTEQQAGSLEETAASVEQLTSTVKKNAEHAHQANQFAMDASEIAIKGSGVVSQVVGTMGDINASSNKIVDIISVIDGIAFQTNILALNAAVEAARAGEQGRGFAVVASEVRGLAQRSAAAAKEIKVLIDDSVEKVGSGSLLVEQAGVTMTEMVESVKRVTTIMQEIAVASREQSSDIEQINHAITEMDNTTQQNAALVEQATATAELLQFQAERLSQAGQHFKLVTR